MDNFEHTASMALLFCHNTLIRVYKQETEAAEKLRIAKSNLEILNEKMTAQLEETGKRLQLAESRSPQLEAADSKSWKSIVVTR